MFTRLKHRRLERRARQHRQIKTLLRVETLETGLLNSSPLTINADSPDGPIVSLTSFGPRVQTVHLSIESLLQQTVRPSRIILWLTEADFSSPLPQFLKWLVDRGVEIKSTPDDLRSYKKFYYTLQDNPSSVIITADDDVIYPRTFIEGLLRAHTLEPELVHCYRAHRLELNDTSGLKPYNSWPAVVDPEEGLDVFPTGNCGVLYPPGCFGPQVFDKELFLKLCPLADDVWLKANTLLTNTPCKVIPSGLNWKDQFLTVPGSQQISLKSRNTKGANLNDRQLQETFSHFDLFSLLQGPKGKSSL